MKADLHLHTNNSDCSESPETVFKMAKKSKMDIISITDHDTVFGIEENKKLAEKYGIIYIPGVEISAYDKIRNKKCHIVGLLAHNRHKELNELLSYITHERHRISREQVKILIKLGYDISEEDFKTRRGAHGYFKQHIMTVLIERGYADSLYGDFFKKMFKNKGPLDISIDYPSAELAVKLLRDAGCIPILAHPNLYGNLPYLDDLISAGLLGIEVNYSSASPEEKIKLNKIAEEKGLYKSAGSDFHGIYRSPSKRTEVGQYYTEEMDFLLDLL